MKILLNYKTLLKKYGVKPSKKLGQNFLINNSVLEQIIDAANLSPKDIVLEIGPGLGILTIELAKQAKKVITVEKDKRMCKILKEILGDYRNVEIVNQDALSYELEVTNYKIIANLPYYVTSPVIRKFLEAKHKPELMVLMVQKEVSQRIVARPPRMNLLAVAVQFYAEAKIVSYVSKKSFWPQPKIDSAIIKIIPQKVTNLPTNNHKKFFEIIRAGFSSKRKMLKNNLSSTSLEASKIEKALKEIGLNPKARAENLSISDWLKLYVEYCKIHQN